MFNVIARHGKGFGCDYRVLKEAGRLNRTGQVSGHTRRKYQTDLNIQNRQALGIYK